MKIAQLTNNMGAAKKEELEEFAAKVIEAENFKGWTMHWSDTMPGVCLLKSKVICIPKTQIGHYPWQAKLYVLHELAHIRTLSKDFMHGEIYFKEYASLILKYLAGEA